MIKFNKFFCNIRCR